MALHWNLSEIEDFHALHNTGPDGEPKGSDADLEGDRQWAITNHLIWMTLGVGLNRITEDNCEEFYRRLVLLSYQSGHGYGDADVTLADLRRRIGLSTNANVETKAAFDNRLKKEMVKRAERAVEKAKRAEEKEAA